jgi:hypothetical protein
MDIKQFAKAVALLSEKELNKVRLLAYYHQKTTGNSDFSRTDIGEWFSNAGLTNPNLSRIERNLAASRAFVRGKVRNTFRLHPNEFDLLQTEIPGIHVESEDVISDDLILPRELYENTRGFIVSLAKQINASYEFNIFDGCAVLMRRLLEILLILSYEHLGIEKAIQDQDGNYFMLEKILNDAKANKTLKLSRDAKSVMDDFRTLGNFSAHKIYYNCHRSDLKTIALHYRATIEELLYKSAIRS